MNNYKDFLSQIYSAYEQGNMALATSYDGSDMANALAAEMRKIGLQDYYIIMDGTVDTGRGIGIHSVGDDDNYLYGFYVGEFVNGMRQGYGEWFYDFGIEDPYGCLYYSYKGEWANNMPNGIGELRTVDTVYVGEEEEIPYSYINSYNGTFLNGLANGSMTMSFLIGSDAKGILNYPSFYLFGADNGRLYPTAVAVIDVKHSRDLAYFGVINGPNDPEENSNPFSYYDEFGNKQIGYYVGIADFATVLAANPNFQEWAASNNYYIYTMKAQQMDGYDDVNGFYIDYSYDGYGTSADNLLGVAGFYNY